MNSLRATAIFGLVPGILLVSCSESPSDPLGTGRFPTIYGDTDIHEPLRVRRRCVSSASCGAQRGGVRRLRARRKEPERHPLQGEPDVTSRLAATTDRPLCAGEPFETQPALSACSGVLIAEDLVLDSVWLFAAVNPVRTPRSYRSAHLAF